MKITVLNDLQPHALLHSEFGLSLLLETESGQWLFDVGAEQALQFNMQILNPDKRQPGKIILSHGHYDHTGGLACLLPGEIFCCRGIDDAHYSYHGPDDVHDIAMPAAARAIFQQSSVHYIERFTQVDNSFYLTGPIPRRSFEDCGGRFFHDQACTITDSVAEEQALLTVNGVLITGCCHAGIINTLEYCQLEQPEISIRTVVGGLHLRSASTEKLTATAEYLRKSRIQELYLLHCTGENAIAQLRKLLPECRIYTPRLGECFDV